jgi:diguanylate cyclase (GGDEF)-like protein
MTMMLDTFSLRVAFGVMSVALLVLFYFVTFRSTRSAYSGWWCAALASFLAGSAAFLLDATRHQWWANPLGNCLLVIGAASVWAGARSFRDARLPLSKLALAPAVTGLTAAFDNPTTNTWAGGPIFLASMSLLIGLAARELWQPDDYSHAHRAMSLAAGGLSTFYAGRLIAFIAFGPADHAFLTYFGSAVTTLVTMVLLVFVSFTITALSNEQTERDLRGRATLDGLTGVLNRYAFLDLAADRLRDMKRTRTSGSLVLADLDHFKQVNDTYGHQAGDAAIQAFAQACSDTVRSTDLVGRYGGEEFLLFLPGAEGSIAESVASQVSLRVRAANSLHPFPLPTVSYGIVSVDGSTTDLTSAIAAADAALYRAKDSGRNRAVHSPYVSEDEAEDAQKATTLMVS